MRVNRIKTKKRCKITTHSRHRRPIFPNLLKEKPIYRSNTAWVSDITYIRTYEGWIYLCIVLDVFSRSIVGWSMGERITDDLVMHAFLKVVMKRNTGNTLTFHSDRGSQYASYRFRNLLLQYNIAQSMSDKGNCYDNAVAESFFGTLKRELKLSV